MVNFLTNNEIIMKIPSVENFELYKEKEKEINKSSDEFWIEFLVKKITDMLDAGNFKIIKNTIEIKISGHYRESIIEEVNKLFVEKGWKRLEIKKDAKSSPFYFSNVTLIK